jgi:hypothetical protein
MKAEGCVQRHQLAVLNSGSVRPEFIEGLLENEECFDRAQHERGEQRELRAGRAARQMGADFAGDDCMDAGGGNAGAIAPG